ncbi:MAG: hypothetical protein ACOVMG_00180 [Flavobacterium sp.]
MKNFSIKNPLSIIAVFSTITEGLCIYGLPKLTNENQGTFVWFIICFPTILIILFFSTLNFNHEVLYSPSDFIGVDKNTTKKFLKGNKYNGGQKESIDLKSHKRTQTEVNIPSKGKQQIDIDKFLENSSIIGVFALFAVSLSKRKNKPFYINELCDEVVLLSGEYTIGYLIAVSSLSLFSRTNYSKKWEVVEYNDELLQKINGAVEKRIKDNPKEANYLNDQKKLIEKFFI